MWNYDGWNSDFKYGIVTPHADIGPEAEAQAMLGGMKVTIHGARIAFSPMHPGGLIDEKIAHDPVVQFVSQNMLDDVVANLSSSPLDAIGLAFTSSSFKIGVSKEKELVERLRQLSHNTRLVTTACAAACAIRHLKLSSIAIMAPSWFDDELCQSGKKYFEDQGVFVAAASPCGPPGGPLQITPRATSRAVQELAASSGAEAVFIAGNGQRAVGVINHVERTTGITVLTANQVLLWAALNDQDLRRKIHGYGRLFAPD